LLFRRAGGKNRFFPGGKRGGKRRGEPDDYRCGRVPTGEEREAAIEDQQQKEGERKEKEREEAEDKKKRWSGKLPQGGALRFSLQMRLGNGGGASSGKPKKKENVGSARGGK